MIAPLVAFPLLLAFWLFVAWRTRVERGRVHLSEFQMFARRMARAAIEVDALIRLGMSAVLGRTSAALVEWNHQMHELQRKITATAPDIAKALGWLS